MKPQLQVALIQTNLVWENPLQNRLNLNDKLEHLNFGVDLVVLPELFTSGFTMSPELVAESMEGETIQWLKHWASKKQCAITGSLVIKEHEVLRNRMVFIKPNGDLSYYDKRHSFTLAGEHKVYTSGKEKVIVDYKGFKICLQICYDLRFPVFSRNQNDYDVLIYVANWPKVRVEAWSALLKARAIENMSYCIGVNRVGLDANNHEYSGHSAAFDGLGQSISTILPYKEQVEVVTLDKEALETLRTKLNFLSDADEFTLHV